MHPLLTIATRAAHAAGEVLLRAWGRVDLRTAEEKSANDFVSAVDRNAEAVIIETIRQNCPTHAFLAEENSHSGNTESDHLWIIDPLDGTTNYLHEMPQFAVSIALSVRGELELGVIYDPLREELFSASRGDGAFCNNHRIRVSQHRQLHGALLATGIPFGERAQTELETCLQRLRLCMPHIAGIRRAGSAALDLAWVASGRLDGFWEEGLKTWDIAAGAVLVQQAGGIISDMRGEGRYLEHGGILAANGEMHALLHKLFTNHPLPF